MTKRAIPQLPADASPALKAIKENLEVMMGQRGGKIETLPTTATLADVIAKVNQLIEKLQ